MCIAMPAKVIAVGPGPQAEVEMEGFRRKVSLLQVPNVSVGAYVLVRYDMVMEVLSEEEVKAIRELFKELTETPRSPSRRARRRSTLMGKKAAPRPGPSAL